jgi:hypothetical protein
VRPAAASPSRLGRNPSVGTASEEGQTLVGGDPSYRNSPPTTPRRRRRGAGAFKVALVMQDGGEVVEALSSAEMVRFQASLEDDQGT